MIASPGGAASSTAGVDRDLRALLASVADTGPALAFVVHTYSGLLDEAFDLEKGPRLTPADVRDDALRVPADALCVVRAIPRFG